MKTIIFAAAVCSLIFAASAAKAGDTGGDNEPFDVNCRVAISAEGATSNVDGSADWKKYKGQIPQGLAKRRAIDNWEAIVSTNCPQYSARWWRSRSKDVSCEGAAGHEYCTATATPARKLLGFLMPE